MPHLSISEYSFKCTLSSVDQSDIIPALLTGAIDIEEFIAGTINLSAMQSSDNLAAVFEEFDTDGSGQHCWVLCPLAIMHGSVAASRR